MNGPGFGESEPMGAAALLAKLRALKSNAERNEAAFQEGFLADAAELSDQQLAILAGQLGPLGVRLTWWKRAVMERRGGKKKGRPSAHSPNPTTPTILINEGAEWEVNASAERALAALPDIYQRMGELVRIVESVRRRPGSREARTVKEIRCITEPYLRELLTKAAAWKEGDEEGGEKKAHPPDWCVRSLHDWHVWPNMRHLHHFADAPVILADGSVLSKPGYDEATGILCEPKFMIEVPPAPPTQADAMAAAARLMGLVSQFPFENDARKSGWLAALLTPIARCAFDGQAPFFMLDANQSGSGKTKLLKVIGLIALGRDMDFVVQTENEEEERKRITSKVLSGAPMVLIDNIDKPFGSAALEALLTTGVWSDRILHTMDAPTLDAWITWYGSANNIQYKRDDTRRRCCVIRLVTEEARPEERSNFDRPDLEGDVARERISLYSDAVTVLRAWLMSGKKPSDLPGYKGAWGSFDDWDRVVRGAIVYAGLPDPIDAKGTVGVEAVREGLVELVEGLAEVITEDEKKSKEMWIKAERIFELLSENDDKRWGDRSYPQLYKTIRAAFRSFYPSLKGGTPSSNQIGNLLGKWKQKPIPVGEDRGKRIVAKTLTGTVYWSVEEVQLRRTARPKQKADQDVEREGISGEAPL